MNPLEAALSRLNPISGWNQRNVIVFASLAAFYFFLISLANFFLITPEQGEAYVLTLGRLWVDGGAIYRDQAFHHPPLGPIVHGVVMAATGWGWAELRIFNMVLLAVALIFAVDAARRLAGPFAMAAVLISVIFSGHFISYHAFVSNRALATLAVTGAIWIMSLGRKDSVTALAACLAAGLGAMSRITLAPFFLIIVAWAAWRSGGISRGFLVVAGALAIEAMLAWALIPDLRAFYQQAFLITSDITRLYIPTMDDFSQANSGVRADGGLLLAAIKQKALMIWRVLSQGLFINEIPWKQLGLFAIIAGFLWRPDLRHSLKGIGADGWFILLGAGSWFGVTWFLPHYWFHALPMIALALAIIVDRLAASSRAPEAMRRLYLLATMLMAVEFAYPSQIVAGHENEMARLEMPDGSLVERPQIPYLMEAAALLASHTKPGDVVLAGNAILVALAERRIAPGMGEQDWSYRPFWGNEVNRRLAYINAEMLYEMVETRLPAAIIVSDNELNPLDFAHVYNGVPNLPDHDYGLRLKPLIEAGYRPIGNFPQITHHLRNITIYLRKDVREH